MAIACYLAMTAQEVGAAMALPPHMAWMACHFSCYGAGLTDLPKKLPKNAMVIIDDCTPIRDHDLSYILEQLQALYDNVHPGSFLLDFQRTGFKKSGQLAELLTRELPCPVGVSQHYAKELSCPVFLSSPLPNVSLEQHFAPWQGREVWLEIATEAFTITVTERGSHAKPDSRLELPEPSFQDRKLHCRYHIELQENAAVFHLARQKEDAMELLSQAESLGITQAIALYQQLG